MRSSQRIVYVGQWVPTVLLPIWWFVAPGGFEPGWAAILMLFIAPLGFLVTLVPVLVSTIRRANRQVRAVSRRYVAACVGLWIVSFLVPVTIDGASDAETFPSFAARADMPWAGTITPLLVIAWLVAVSLAVIAAVRPPTTTPEAAASGL